MNRIFIQLAAYKETELIPTVCDALLRARHPERLVFGIFDQVPAKTILDEQIAFSDIDLKGAELRIEFFDCDKAQGVGWARAMSQRLYQDEKLVLHIDSHMRFIPEWDVAMESMWQLLGPNSLLTAYPPQYTPPNTLDPRPVSHSIGVKHFNEDGTTAFWSQRLVKGRPQPGFTLAAGFVFGAGQWIKDVPSDPLLYFGDEEITTAARSWTAGYDIYFPHEHLCYHYYNRLDGVRHWDDHEWAHHKDMSLSRFHGLFRGEDFGPYSMGSVRSVAEYEHFSGVFFGKRVFTQRARLGYPNLPEYEQHGSDELVGT